MPSAWETLAVDALALLVSSTAEMVQYATARRGVTATDFPRLYRPAYLVLLECAEEHINTGNASERVDMVQFGQRLQEKQHSTGTRVWCSDLPTSNPRNMSMECSGDMMSS
ncbi:hypothetical protein [Corynebacterium amycolatum]